eukprot:4230376-Pleurochrysis_carterae.AAC.1
MRSRRTSAVVLPSAYGIRNRTHDSDGEDGVRARRARVHVGLSDGAAAVALRHELLELQPRRDGQLEQALDVHAERWVLFDLKSLLERLAAVLLRTRTLRPTAARVARLKGHETQHSNVLKKNERTKPC